MSTIGDTLTGASNDNFYGPAIVVTRAQVQANSPSGEAIINVVVQGSLLSGSPVLRAVVFADNGSGSYPGALLGEGTEVAVTNTTFGPITLPSIQVPVTPNQILHIGFFLNNGAINDLLDWSTYNVAGNMQTTLYTGLSYPTAPNTFPSGAGQYPISMGMYANLATTTSGGTTNPAPGAYLENAGTTVQVTATPNSGYSFYWLLDGVNVGSTNPYTVTMNSNHTLTAVFVSTPITPTPTYILNWAITPLSGNLPFTINFSGYLSRSNSTPDTGTIVNGETIQLQVLAPGGTTWANTAVTATTGPGTSGNGYFSGAWNLAEPTIYPGPWQFRVYYAGNTTKNLFGCEKTLNHNKKRDLSRVNALIL